MEIANLDFSLPYATIYDSEGTPNFHKARAVSTKLFVKSDIVVSGVKNYINYTIQDGLKPKFQITDPTIEREKRKILEGKVLKLYRKWAKKCVISGTEDETDNIKQVMAAILKDGDCLTHVTNDSTDTTIPSPRLRRIKAKEIRNPTGPVTNIKTGELIDLTGFDVTMGVVYRPDGLIVGYTMPSGKGKDYLFLPVSFGSLVTSILAKNPVQPLDYDRGLPFMYCSVDTYNEMQIHRDSAVKRAAFNSKLSIIFETTREAEEALKDPETVLNDLKDLPDNKINAMLAPVGMKPNFLDHKEDSFNLETFVKPYKKTIAQILGTNYEILYKDPQDLSFSSNKSQLAIIWQDTQVWRTYLGNKLLVPIFDIFLKAAKVEGFIEDIDFEYSIEFIGKKMDSLRPIEDLQAQKFAVENGLVSIDEVLAESGRDPLDVAERQANYQEQIASIQKERLLNADGKVDVEVNTVILSVLEKVNAGTIKPEQAKSMLVNLYNLNEDLVSSLIS